MGRQVLVNEDNVQLPNGNLYNTGDVVVLTDAQWAALSSTAVSSGTLTDQGAAATPDDGDQVTVQAVDVPNLGALTSTQNATAAATDLATAEALANALKANYNALQTDVAAIHDKLNTLLANLRVASGPMA